MLLSAGTGPLSYSWEPPPRPPALTCGERGSSSQVTWSPKAEARGLEGAEVGICQLPVPREVGLILENQKEV